MNTFNGMQIVTSPYIPEGFAVFEGVKEFVVLNLKTQQTFAVPKLTTEIVFDLP